MADDAEYPVLFDEATPQLFRGRDIRARAETQRANLLPKLRPLLDTAREHIEQAYEIDPLADSRWTERPAFREDAVETRAYDDVYLGFAPKRTVVSRAYLKPDGTEARGGYFRLIVQLYADGLLPNIQVERLPEARLLWEIMQSESDAVLAFFERHGLQIWAKDETVHELDDREKLRKVALPTSGRWWHTGVAGDHMGYPVDEADGLLVSHQFAALFAVYQAMIDAANGRPPRLRDYLEAFERELDQDEAASEGPPLDASPATIGLHDPGQEEGNPAWNGRPGEESPELGLRGELHVMEMERRRLTEAGRPDLAGRIVHVSQEEGDGAGYDIRSFDADGSEVWIEVKTTNGPESTSFLVSRNEVACSEREPGRFRLYRVFDFSGDPRLFVLKGSLRDHCRLDPTEYRATLKRPEALR